MAHHDVALKLGDIRRRDDAILERAKAGGDAVGDHAVIEQLLHGLGGAHYALAGCSRQTDFWRTGRAVGNSDHLVDGELGAV
jgi:hypothetical protein